MLQRWNLLTWIHPHLCTGGCVYVSSKNKQKNIHAFLHAPDTDYKCIGSFSVSCFICLLLFFCTFLQQWGINKLFLYKYMNILLYFFSDRGRQQFIRTFIIIVCFFLICALSVRGCLECVCVCDGCGEASFCHFSLDT